MRLLGWRHESTYDSENFFGENTDQWKWGSFLSTISFPVSKDLMDWIIGQEKAKLEIQLSIDEWINKMVYLKKNSWWKDFEDPMGRKPQPKQWLPPGPFILLLGDPGTGKSLLGRAMQNYLDQQYKKHDITLYDIVSWKNPVLPSEPKVSIHPASKGKELMIAANRKVKKKGWFSRWGLKLFMVFIIPIGVLLFGVGLYSTWQWMNDGYSLATSLTVNATLLAIGCTVMFSGIFLGIFGKMLGNLGGQNQQGIGGASTSQGPKLLVDNSSNLAPFVDATGHGSAQLFGSIAWDPYQTGGLGTPEHQRVNAGDVHRAHLGILYIDEIKNLIGMEAITLLTVLEDGQLPIALRSQFHGGDTAAMMVSTEPVPCTVFFIAAGNMDSVPQVHPALMDRITGYGKVVYMNTDMPNTVGNRRKFVQFISQEANRFNLLPFSRDACIEIIEEARRKSGRKDRLTCMFRQMISILKTASILAINEGSKTVEKKHVKSAVSDHCKTIAVQMMERNQEQHDTYRIVNPNSKPKIGQIYGLAVTEINGEFSGSVMPLRASMIKNTGEPEEGYCHVTGVQTEERSWVQHSISKIKHVILQLCNTDPEINYKTHIDFAQNIGVDGPSAGVAMTLLLLSILKNKPIRQDSCVTGEINIGIEKQMVVTPIGGVHAKIMAAQNAGFKKICIPKLNYEVNIDPNDYTIKVKPCNTIEDYMNEMFVT